LLLSDRKPADFSRARVGDLRAPARQTELFDITKRLRL
jgi:hypothetical protein